jgi:hypothetical protein
MRNRLFHFSIVAALACLATSAQAHEDEYKGRLGRVSFASSCDPKVQAELERGVAMLHSFWFTAGEATFRSVLEKDPGCGTRA